jgi:YfiH family protein
MSQQAVNHAYPISVNNILLYRVHTFDSFPELNYAMFTRQGGVSQTPYQSLNLGSTVGDDPVAVQTNFTRVCRALDIHPEQTASCFQVHSTDILTVDRDNRQAVMGRVDGLITTEPDIYLNLRFADCTPLLFYDPVRHAIGLTHAGWRGTMQNAAGATVKAMVRDLGCKADNIIAVIGPAIGPCCYEVGTEVMETAASTFADPSSLFQHNGNAGHAHFDMWAANYRQLAASGVKQIIRSELCTACHTDKFFSHRAEKGKTGRFGVMMGLRGAGR